MKFTNDSQGIGLHGLAVGIRGMGILSLSPFFFGLLLCIILGIGCITRSTGESGSSWRLSNAPETTLEVLGRCWKDNMALVRFYLFFNDHGLWYSLGSLRCEFLMGQVAQMQRPRLLSSDDLVVVLFPDTQTLITIVQKLLHC